MVHLHQGLPRTQQERARLDSREPSGRAWRQALGGVCEQGACGPPGRPCRPAFSHLSPPPAMSQGFHKFRIPVFLWARYLTLSWAVSPATAVKSALLRGSFLYGSRADPAFPVSHHCKGPSCLSPGPSSGCTGAPGFVGAAPSAQNPLPRSSFFLSTGTRFRGQEPTRSRHPLSIYESMNAEGPARGRRLRRDPQGAPSEQSFRPQKRKLCAVSAAGSL